MHSMKTPRSTPTRSLCLLCGLFLLLDRPHTLFAEPTPAAIAAFNAYAAGVESRLARQHAAPGTFLAATASLQPNQLLIDRVPASLPAPLDGALLHHWRGTAFAPGAHAADFERLLRDFNAYPEHFAPQVTQARILSVAGDRMTATMRVRQHHVLTVVMDATYDIAFGELDRRHGYSISRSTRIDEIADAGSAREHALTPETDHGFLWRLNTYWSYEERDGGLYLQIETVSLTRSIPAGLGWAVRPYIESIPRESMEFTLRSAVDAIRK
jgi:hypothetical protein